MKNHVIENDTFKYIIEHLKNNSFNIILVEGEDSLSSCNVECNNVSANLQYSFVYQLPSLPSLINISSKSDIPLCGIIIMRIVAKIICTTKIIYKAIVLDLDETLWKGTLSEEGISGIIKNMQSEEGIHYISFMKYVKSLAEELGIYIALCSRNDASEVESAIEMMDENIFPLKNQIDIIIANNNNKSDNILEIASQLSILPNAIVFIDDNKIVRDEVRSKLPYIFVPEWKNHEDVVFQLITSCIFERNEISISSKNRRRLYRIIKSERNNHSLPSLIVKASVDDNHNESIKLYSKSNQFHFYPKQLSFNSSSKSYYFEIFREDGENLGICSAITINISHSGVTIQNWAMSCRYFEIGLEESILLFVRDIAQGKRVFINHFKSQHNQKVSDLLIKYPEVFQRAKDGCFEIIYSSENTSKLQQGTSLSMN